MLTSVGAGLVVPGPVELLCLLGEGLVGGAHELVLPRLRVAMMEQHRLKEVEVLGKDEGSTEQDEEDQDAREGVHEGHHQGARAGDGGCARGLRG